MEKMFNDLPLIHATIKMHKNPIKFRFIIGSRTGVIKPAAKRLVQILKLVMKTHSTEDIVIKSNFIQELKETG